MKRSWKIVSVERAKAKKDYGSRPTRCRPGKWIAFGPITPAYKSCWSRNIKDIPLLEEKTDSEGKPLFSQITLKPFRASTKEWAGGFRFKVPREARTFVWAFLPPPQFTPMVDMCPFGRGREIPQLHPAKSQPFSCREEP
jgi:hypothetical protein